MKSNSGGSSLRNRRRPTMAIAQRGIEMINILKKLAKFI